MEILSLLHVDLERNLLNLSLVDKHYAEVLDFHNTYVVGDLHGSYYKIISVIVHLGFVSYRPSLTYSFFSNISYIIQSLCRGYRSGGEMQGSIFELLENTFEVVPQKKPKTIYFIGDTHCDRGPSDFIIFCIFMWMQMKHIRFFVILGNHELMVIAGKGFSQRPNPLYFKFNAAVPDSDMHPFVHSFDYFKINPSCRKLFTEMYREFWTHVSLFRVFLEKRTSRLILLTHAPASNESFWNLLKDYNRYHGKKITIDLLFHPDSSQRDDLDHLICDDFLPRQMNGLTVDPEDHDFLQTIYNFCENRDTANPVFSVNGRWSGGVNIFGHMGGVFEEEKKLGIETVPHASQVCLDTVTGMPETLVGPVVYACLNI